jgi:hypothetical protein
MAGKMNYIKHLTGFFNRIALENSLNPTHISLYMTLFQCWNVNRFKNPITISRDEMMKGSKIASKATYHKCIKELQRLKFLDYFPSYNPYSGTEVFMVNFSEGINSSQNISETTSSNNDQTIPIFEPTEPKNEQVNGQVAEQVNELPYIYNNKQTLKNNKNIDIDTNFQNFENDLVLKNETAEQKEKSSAKKEKVKSPTLESVKEYFKFQNFTEFEAERFFNYYSSTGWLIGGKTKMRDWKAAARNWIMNQDKFKIKTPIAQLMPHNLNIANNKNYAEPL